jgi:hypothetical protein
MMERLPGEYELARRQADQARTDFAAIEGGLEFIMGQLARMPTGRHLGWVAAAAFAGGAVFATLVNVIFWR